MTISKSEIDKLVSPLEPTPLEPTPLEPTVPADQDSVFTGETEQAAVLGVLREFLRKPITNLPFEARRIKYFQKPPPPDQTIAATPAKAAEKSRQAVERIQKAAKKRTPGMTPSELKAGEAAATGGTPRTGEVFNYTKYDEPISKTLESIVKHYGISYEKMTIESMVESAKNLGIGQDYIGEIVKKAKDLRSLPVDVIRAHLTIPVIAKDLRIIADRFASATPEEAEALHSQYESARDTLLAVIYAAKGVQVPVAQAMRVMQEFRPVMTGDMADIIRRDQIFAAALTDMVGTKNVLSLLQKGSKTNFVKELWLSTYINGMLSAPPTHALNIAASGLFTLSSPFTRELAAFPGDFRNALSIIAGKGPVDDRVRHGEGLAGLYAMIIGSGDALRAMGLTLRTGLTLDQRIAAKLGVEVDPRITMDLKNIGGLRAEEYGFDGALAMALTKWAQFISLPGRALASADDAFKLLARNFEESAVAYRAAKAYQRQLLESGINPVIAESKAAERLAQLRENPTEEILERADDFSQMITFTRGLPQGSFFGIANDYANDHIAVKVMFPFIKSLTWIASESAQHSPLAPLSRQWREDILAGGAKRDIALAKFGEGLIVASALYPMIQNGDITGPGPFNPEVRKNYLATGWRPFSWRIRRSDLDDETIKTLKDRGIEYHVVGKTVDPAIAQKGDIFIPYAQLAPLAGVFAMTSSYVEYIRYTDDNADEMTDVALPTVLAIGDLAKEVPVLRSVADFANIFSGGDKSVARKVIDYATNLTTKFAIEGSPAGAYSSLIAWTERSMNNKPYEIKAPANTPPGFSGAYEAIIRKASRTPGLSANLKQKLNFFGEPINLNDPEYAPMSVMNIRPSGATNDPAFAVLSALNIRAKQPDQFISRNGVRVQLTNDQHYRLRQMFGEPFVRLNPDGTTVTTNIKELIVSTATDPNFLLLPYAHQQVIISNLISTMRTWAEDRMLASEEGKRMIDDMKLMLQQQESGTRSKHENTIWVQPGM